MDFNILQLSETNERNQASIKSVNDSLEDQNFVLNRVTFTTAEAIHGIFVRLRDLETSGV